MLTQRRDDQHHVVTFEVALARRHGEVVVDRLGTGTREPRDGARKHVRIAVGAEARRVADLEPVVDRLADAERHDRRCAVDEAQDVLAPLDHLAVGREGLPELTVDVRADRRFREAVDAAPLRVDPFDQRADPGVRFLELRFELAPAQMQLLGALLRIGRVVVAVAEKDAGLRGLELDLQDAAFALGLVEHALGNMGVGLGLVERGFRRHAAVGQLLDAHQHGGGFVDPGLGRGHTGLVRIDLGLELAGPLDTIARRPVAQDVERVVDRADLLGQASTQRLGDVALQDQVVEADDVDQRVGHARELLAVRHLGAQRQRGEVDLAGDRSAQGGQPGVYHCSGAGARQLFAYNDEAGADYEEKGEDDA